MNTTTAAPDGRRATWHERLPAWLTSPKLFVPLAVVAMLALLFSFASVVQEIVHQGEVGNGAATPPPITSPAVQGP